MSEDVQRGEVITSVQRRRRCGRLVLDGAADELLRSGEAKRIFLGG